MYASNEERLALKNTSFGLDLVVRFSKDGKESEICCDDFAHAYNSAMAWKHTHSASYVELFRVNNDGSLTQTIGAL